MLSSRQRSLWCWLSSAPQNLQLSLSPSMNLTRPFQRLAHLGAVKPRRAGGVEDRFLAPGDCLDRLGQPYDRIRRDHDRAVKIGVDHVVMPRQHAEDIRVAAHLHHMDVRVAWADPPAENLEARREHVEVAERSIGDAAFDAEREMRRRLHLAPEGAIAGLVVDVLDTAMVGRPSAAT